jgi:hypothetical protein
VGHPGYKEAGCGESDAVHEVTSNGAGLGDRDPSLARHRRGLQLPTEAINLLIKMVKPLGHGFRNFAHYRLRLRRQVADAPDREAAPDA